MTISVRDMMGNILSPSSPWHYLWGRRHDAALGRILDAAYSYEPGSGLWAVDVAFAGQHPLECYEFAGPRYAPPMPFMLVSAAADIDRSSRWTRGIIFYPAEDFAERWRLAWSNFGGCYCWTLDSWHEAAREADAYRTRSFSLRLRPGERL